MNDPNALWEDLLPYQWNLMLNSNQGYPYLDNLRP